MQAWIEPVRAALAQSAQTLGALALCAVFFAALAWLVKGRASIDDARAAAGETRINAVLSVFDHLLVSPFVALLAAAVMEAFKAHGVGLAPPTLWLTIGELPTLIVAIFVGDFAGYWRHRLQHSRWLWPAHAIHHSDTRLTWFSLERMHPVDRLGTMLDIVVLSALGFPFWAVAGVGFVRHYYGYFIHADLPWTLGKAGWVLNSPAMHRWHHARDVEGSGHNFATVFSVFDRAFGTYHQPGPCTAPLGVREDMGKGAWGQYVHPLKVWRRALRPARDLRPDPAPLA
ncbi:MAG TPA: sterol desaturase family protein [Phenylobacterium sp.]|nr:sterol desaturase family protein [Phenylobacterium sp.]